MGGWGANHFCHSTRTLILTHTHTHPECGHIKIRIVKSKAARYHLHFICLNFDRMTSARRRCLAENSPLESVFLLGRENFGPHQRGGPQRGSYFLLFSDFKVLRIVAPWRSLMIHIHIRAWYATTDTKTMNGSEKKKPKQRSKYFAL